MRLKNLIHTWYIRNNCKKTLVRHNLVDLSVIHAAVGRIKTLAEQKTEKLCAVPSPVPCKEVLIGLGTNFLTRRLRRQPTREITTLISKPPSITVEISI